MPCRYLWVIDGRVCEMFVLGLFNSIRVMKYVDDGGEARATIVGRRAVVTSYLSKKRNFMEAKYW